MHYGEMTVEQFFAELDASEAEGKGTESCYIIIATFDAWSCQEREADINQALDIAITKNYEYHCLVSFLCMTHERMSDTSDNVIPNIMPIPKLNYPSRAALVEYFTNRVKAEAPERYEGIFQGLI